MHGQQNIKKNNKSLCLTGTSFYIYICVKHFGMANIKFKQALWLCIGRTAHRGSSGIALLFLDRGTGRGWEFSVTPRPLFIPGKDPVLIVQEAEWAPGPVWTGAKNLAPTGIRSRTDWATRPVCIQCNEDNCTAVVVRTLAFPQGFIALKNSIT